MVFENQGKKNNEHLTCNSNFIFLFYIICLGHIQNWTGLKGESGGADMRERGENIQNL